MFKKCFKCGQEKPLSEFYRHREMADGHLNKCKDCTKKERTKYVSENPGRVLKTRLAVSEKNPTGVNARRVVEAALAAGEIERPDRCQMCNCTDGERRIEAHHHDYARPLDVVWLCTPCHRMADARRREAEGLPGNAVSKAVVMKMNGKKVCKFESIAQAAKAVGRSATSIKQCLSGKSRTSAGFEWEYEVA